MDFEFAIEEAKVSDLAEVRSLYAHYVENTTVSLEEKTPSAEQLIDLYSDILGKNLPFLVAKSGKTVVGFCYAQPFRKRSAYRYTVEESVYVHKDYLRKGIASQLVAELIKRCREVGYKQLIAIVVADDNEQSIEFHETMGFVAQGRLSKVGFKFNEWLDIVMMQKEL